MKKPCNCQAPTPGGWACGGVPVLTNAARRYIVLDPTCPSEDGPLPGGLDGQVLGTFTSQIKAKALALQEMAYGNLAVLVIDSADGAQLFPSDRPSVVPEALSYVET